MSSNYGEQFKNFIIANEGSSKKKVTLLVDGLNLFIRSFSAVPTLNDNGEHTGAITGFYKTLLRIIRECNVNRVIVAFDGKGGNTRRRKLFSDYKGKRVNVGSFNRFEAVDGLVDEGESFRRQLGIIFESFEYLPLHFISIDNVEADDVLAYIANEIVPKDELAIIASSDKDYLQLVGDNINVYSLHKKMLITPDNIFNEIGYLPKNYLTLRCFVGNDVSDNISGIDRLGEKTMTKLFDIKSTERDFTIDDIINEAHMKVQAGAKDKVLRTILERRDIVYRNYDLMQLYEPPISGILSAQVRRILDTPCNTFDKMKFHALMLAHGVVYRVEDLGLWNKVN